MKITTSTDSESVYIYICICVCTHTHTPVVYILYGRIDKCFYIIYYFICIFTLYITSYVAKLLFIQGASLKDLWDWNFLIIKLWLFLICTVQSYHCFDHVSQFNLKRIEARLVPVSGKHALYQSF